MLICGVEVAGVFLVFCVFDLGLKRGNVGLYSVEDNGHR